MRFFETLREILEGPPEPEDDSYLMYMSGSLQNMQLCGYTERDIAREIKKAKRYARQAKQLRNLPRDTEDDGGFYH